MRKLAVLLTAGWAGIVSSTQIYHPMPEDRADGTLMGKIKDTVIPWRKAIRTLRTNQRVSSEIEQALRQTDQVNEDLIDGLVMEGWASREDRLDGLVDMHLLERKLKTSIDHRVRLVLQLEGKEDIITRLQFLLSSLVEMNLEALASNGVHEGNEKSIPWLARQICAEMFERILSWGRPAWNIMKSKSRSFVSMVKGYSRARPSVVPSYAVVFYSSPARHNSRSNERNRTAMGGGGDPSISQPRKNARQLVRLRIVNETKPQGDQQHSGAGSSVVIPQENATWELPVVNHRQPRCSKVQRQMMPQFVGKLKEHLLVLKYDGEKLSELEECSRVMATGRRPDISGETCDALLEALEMGIEAPPAHVKLGDKIHSICVQGVADLRRRHYQPPPPPHLQPESSSASDPTTPPDTSTSTMAGSSSASGSAGGTQSSSSTSAHSEGPDTNASSSRERTSPQSVPSPRPDGEEQIGPRVTVIIHANATREPPVISHREPQCSKEQRDNMPRFIGKLTQNLMMLKYDSEKRLELEDCLFEMATGRRPDISRQVCDAVDEASEIQVETRGVIFELADTVHQICVRGVAAIRRRHYEPPPPSHVEPASSASSNATTPTDLSSSSSSSSTTTTTSSSSSSSLSPSSPPPPPSSSSSAPSYHSEGSPTNASWRGRKAPSRDSQPFTCTPECKAEVPGLLEYMATLHDREFRCKAVHGLIRCARLYGEGQVPAIEEEVCTVAHTNRGVDHVYGASFQVLEMCAREAAFIAEGPLDGGFGSRPWTPEEGGGRSAWDRKW